MTDGHLDPSPPGESAPTSAPSVASQTVHASVVVVESHDPTRERLLALLGDSVTPFATIEELTTRLTGTVPVVVVLGPSCSNGDVLAIAERVVAQYPMVGTILVVDELSTSLLQQALRAGVRDVLALTGEAAALAQAVRRVAASLEQPARSAATTVASLVARVPWLTPDREGTMP